MDDNSSVVSDNVEKYADVMEYLASSAYPSGLSKNVKRALRQKAQSFTVEGGVLMHKSGDKLCRVIVDLKERDRIIASLHADEVGGCHYGQSATLRKVTERFWWRNVTADTRVYVRIAVQFAKRQTPGTNHCQLRYTQYLSMESSIDGELIWWGR